MKDDLIREIEQVHRDLGYRRRGRPLSTFSEETLQAYLNRLKRRGGPWQKKERASRQDAKAQS